MNYAKTLIPENDEQELWELAGRVEAAVEYIKHTNIKEKQLLLAMLGKGVEENEPERLPEGEK